MLREVLKDKDTYWYSSIIFLIGFLLLLFFYRDKKIDLLEIFALLNFVGFGLYKIITYVKKQIAFKKLISAASEFHTLTGQRILLLHQLEEILNNFDLSPEEKKERLEAFKTQLNLINEAIGNQGFSTLPNVNYDCKSYGHSKYLFCSVHPENKNCKDCLGYKK